MPKVRLLPVAGATQTITARGTPYTPTPGTPIDVDPADANVLIGNGFVAVARGGGRGSPEPAQVGASSARPTATYGSGTPLAPGTQFIDTTVGVIVFDGSDWRDYAGNAV